MVRRSAVLVATAGVLVAAGSPAASEPDAGESAPPASEPDADVAVNPAAVALGEDVTASTASFEVAAEQAESAPAASTGEESEGDAEPAGSGDASEVISIAKKYLGVPYVWGGSSPSGFDCSGFTSYVYKQVGVDLPRTSSAQRDAGTRVSASEAKPGDLVWHPGHIGIYLGDGKKIHSPQSGDVVKIADLSSSDTVFIRVL